MPSPSPSAELIAHFLRMHDYEETLETFLREAGLPSSTGISTPITLEALLDEKRAFDLSTTFERLGTDSDTSSGWRPGAPSRGEIITNSPPSNILSITISEKNLIFTTADRRLVVLDLIPWPPAQLSNSNHPSPILSCAEFLDRRLTGSMAGQLELRSEDYATSLGTRRDHAKYIVQVAVQAPWVATAAWDGTVLLYRLDRTGLSDPVGTIKLTSNPEAIAFICHPDSGSPVLVVTRRDSTILYYYTVGPEPRLLGRQNLAPHSIAWVAFTPAAIAVCPTDPSLLAIATSTMPHMKLLIVRMLVPPEAQQTATRDETVAARARSDLALQDKEDAAIVVQVSTMAPQTQYSTPALAWRPDGSGVWVNSDDGVIRGLEARTGKLVATLRGHEPATKIRCLASAVVGEEEWLVSGGFDQKLMVWRREGRDS